MKIRFLGAACACALILAISTSAYAALVARLGGQAVYDTDRNITWLANANLAASNTFGVSGINPSGSMTWDVAQNWVAAMNSANYLGFNNWRLPATLQPDVTCSQQSTTSYGSNCSGSEMGHLFYSELAGVAGRDILAIHNSSFSLFSNLQSNVYWSGTEYAPNTLNAWYFDFGGGSQVNFYKFGTMYATAVRSGDVAAASTLYYYNDFQSAAGGEWSRTNIASAPLPEYGGTRLFLGEFGNETVTLSLTGLPSHGNVTVSFNLYLIRAWNGNDTTVINGDPLGPNYWQLNVSGGPVLFNQTFSNGNPAGQSYSPYIGAASCNPGYNSSYPAGTYNPMTGAVECYSLGYMYNFPYGSEAMDSVYNLSFNFPHTSNSLALNFKADGLLGMSNASWGLDNVRVEVGQGPPLIPQALIEIPQQPQYSGLHVIQYSPMAENAVFVTHGWRDNAKPSDNPLEKGWVQLMAEQIKISLNQYPSQNWDIYIYDWEQDAAGGFLGCFFGNENQCELHAFLKAADNGKALAPILAGNKPYKNLHLIAHSAGSNLIETLAGEMKRFYADRNIALPKVHSTFLDSYDPFAGTGSYGISADWAEQYVDARSGPFVIGIDLTSVFNFEVGKLDPAVAPTIGENTFNYINRAHHWPIKWYLCTISPGGDYSSLDTSLFGYPACDITRTSGLFANYGFSTSLESGSLLAPFNHEPVVGKDRYYQRSHGCVLSPGVQPNCGQLNSFIAPPASKFVKQTTPATSFPTIADTAISPTCTQSGTLDFSSNWPGMTLTPCSPAWISSRIQTVEALNIIQFDYEFLSAGEDLLSVFFDGQLVYSADQRVAANGVNHSGEVWVGDAQPGLHTISFRVDPFGTSKPAVHISNLTNGLQSVLAAKAGSAQTVSSGRLVTLDGSGSGDSRGVTIAYSWVQTGGPTVTLSNPTVAKPTFVSPPVSISGQTVAIQLTVTNPQGIMAADSVTITVAKLGDVNVDNSIDIIDLNLILAARNTPASGPNDLRDLDGDGIITALDARKLTTLCTRPRCATQ
ncbi:MAG: PKD domain-containing protein [Sulfuricaulis sp.]